MSLFDKLGKKPAGGSSSKAKKEGPVLAERQQPWVEKYRPKNLSDVTAQDHTISVLKRTLQSSNLPHMLFYGPPGTGKTSTILALAKELYGPELVKTRVLELNASDERGISIVREKVKNFAKISVSNAAPNVKSKYPCPPYKIIILDEADSMTQDAQSALRRTMETYSKITRFCLICNFVTRIIDPLASRCSKFRFKSLDEGNARVRLNEIAVAEKVRVQPDAIERLVNVSDGDLRKAITFLQSAARLHGPPKEKKTRSKKAVAAAAAAAAEAAAKDQDGDESMELDHVPGSTEVTIATVEEIAGVVPESTIDSLMQACEPGSASSRAGGGKSVYDRVSKVVEDIVADGWSATQVLLQMYQRLVFSDALLAKQKNLIVAVFSEVDKRLADGADEHLEILDLALRIAGIMAMD